MAFALHDEIRRTEECARDRNTSTLTGPQRTAARAARERPIPRVGTLDTARRTSSACPERQRELRAHRRGRVVPRERSFGVPVFRPCDPGFAAVWGPPASARAIHRRRAQWRLLRVACLVRTRDDDGSTSADGSKDEPLVGLGNARRCLRDRRRRRFARDARAPTYNGETL